MKIGIDGDNRPVLYGDGIDPSQSDIPDRVIEAEEPPEMSSDYKWNGKGWDYKPE